MLRRICGHGQLKMYTFSSPVGELEVVTCPKGVVHLKMKGTEVSSENFMTDKRITVKSKKTLTSNSNDRVAAQAQDWLKAYFDSPQNVKRLSLPPICFMVDEEKNTSFRRKVWHTLATKVPLGKAVSYGELAVLSGGTLKSSRAVGSAMRNNPVSIIVPCHRVILSSGALGNYSGGKKNCVKPWLLEHEGYISANTENELQ